MKTISDSEAKVIWVTGASSGLGQSLAEALASEGHRVIVSARNEEALHSLEEKHSTVTAIACDTTSKDSMQALESRLRDEFGRLDQIILNAGTCEYLDFPEPDWPAIRRVMEVNYFGTVNCLEVALPLLRQSKDERPHIVVVASQATYAPFPRAEAYGASKAALQYFFSCLRIDLAPENIDVTVVNPGFVDTPLTRQNDFDMPFLMDVDEAARRVVGILDSRPRNYSFPKRLQALLSFSRVMPGLWQKMVSTDKQDSKQ